MATPWVPTLLSVTVVSLLSLVGVLTMMVAKARSHAFMIGLVGLAAGALLGDAFFHLLPEAVEHVGTLDAPLSMTILAGFLVFFLLEVGLRWGHAHGEPAHAHHDSHTGIQPYGWLNLVGDGVHNFIDGALIAAAFLVDVPLGIATAIAVALHELPQELGDFGILVRAGMTPGRALMYNLGSALLAVVGAIIVLAVPLPVGAMEAWAIPLIAGGFLYIAAADLVPELHHHAGSRHIPIVLVSMVAGLASMAALLLMEA